MGAPCNVCLEPDPRFASIMRMNADGSVLDQIFIAEHGSWNRSESIGYRISLVRMQNGRPTYEVFDRGWLADDGLPAGRWILRFWMTAPCWCPTTVPA